jgi:hypothetical protein
MYLYSLQIKGDSQKKKKFVVAVTFLPSLAIKSGALFTKPLNSNERSGTFYRAVD